MLGEFQNEDRSALVIGANGIVGSNMIQHLRGQTRWKLYSVAQTHPNPSDKVVQIAVDLLDQDASRDALDRIGTIDYVFFAALAVRPTPAEQVEPNLAILRNAVTPLIEPSKFLRHVCLVQGTKWYGSHLGPYKTPARESDPRHEGPNFYFNQRDWLSAAQQGQSWTFSTLRPHFVSGFNVGNPNNMIAAIGVYAAIQRELGKPLDFPGTSAAFESLSMATDVSLLNAAMLWASTSPRCSNQDFNINNGDYFRWINVWPRIADAFGMPMGSVAPIKLSEYMIDKEPVWDRIVTENGLRPIKLDRILSWSWADFLFRGEWDDISSTLKARSFGFDHFLNTEDDLIESLARYRAEKVLP